jgi:hypothetical protein
MNTQDQDNQDFLKKYINPEMIEKAPKGFTSKTMTRIRIETQMSVSTSMAFDKYRIPVISVAVTAILITAAILLPSEVSGSAGLAFLQKLSYINFNMPEIKMISFRDLNLPGWIIYASLGALLLAIFDRAISGFFHKEQH